MSDQQSINKAKIIPSTLADMNAPVKTEPVVTKELPIENEEIDEEMEFFLTILPHAQKLRQKLSHLVKGNRFERDSIINALMTAWAYAQLETHTHCLLTDILTELRELNGKKPLEEKRPVGRPRKEERK